jgi:MoaA/NifB/PqqE/SkfB family radical SAM enzyme
MVNKEKAIKAIDKLSSFGVSHLTLTGGEPLLHPNVIEFVERATRNKMHNAVLDAAPQLLLRNDMVKRLEQAGNDMISISFDSGDPETMEASRQIPNIMQDMTKAVEQIRKTKIASMASILIWNDNYDKLEVTFQRAVDMGFDVISLNYPTFSKSQVYPLGGEGISLSKDKVIHGLKESIRIKKTKKFPLINSTYSMQNIIRFLQDPLTVKSLCRGGNRTLFLDWFLDIHPCMQLPKVLGNMLEMELSDLHTETCNDCNMSWYRDFSSCFGLGGIPILLDSIGNIQPIFSRTNQ